MKSVLVTGARGFIARNLLARLEAKQSVRILTIDRSNSVADLRERLQQAQVVFHLAGVNRPTSESEFDDVNYGLTQRICEGLLELDRNPKIVFTSSYQAELANPYGVSKRKAEDVLKSYASVSGAGVCIYRLKGVFGKWCRPNYNSVTATFCHNIARDLPITISDPAFCVNLVYIDDVVDSFLNELEDDTDGASYVEVQPTYPIALGDLAQRIRSLHAIRRTLIVPDLSDRLNAALYATYQSYTDDESRASAPEKKSDDRGCLTELIKSPYFGQIFVSRTKPGVTRGNHYHHTKVEKFIVLEGDALIRMRHINASDVIEYRVCGTECRSVDIPPGFVHSITNIGREEMVVLFWASEIFDPNRPDTYPLLVDEASSEQ